jgi:hypothetical protein
MQSQYPVSSPAQSTNRAASVAVVSGSISLFFTLGITAFILALGGRTWSLDRLDRLPFVLWSAGGFFLGSCFALPSLIAGQVGLSKSSLAGGAGKAATGLVFGYFFYAAYSIAVLVDIAAFSLR